MSWYYALCQHPMYMIIEHDETAAERTPPWGEPDIGAYIGRIRRNLAALEQYPFLKFNYDFSGVELEDLAERAPDLIELFKRYLQAGRVSFVNGSYAQPHLHTLGAESNLRQMTEGLAAIERLVGVRVDTYAHQEPAIHDQMPQILRALGYEFAVTPGFFWVMSFLTPHEILGVQYQGLRFLQDEEFSDWAGLNGSTIPLYLSQPRLRPAGGVHGTDSHREALRNEFVKGLLHYPPIRCDFPDMVEVDQAWLDDHAGQEYVILKEVLVARLQETAVRSRARLYTYWGYGDGIEAERLHRTDRSAERSLLEAEALAALAEALIGRPPDDLQAAWRKLLRAQHHDAYWVAGVGLREKAVQWAQEAQAVAEAVIYTATRAVMAAGQPLPPLAGRPLFVWEPWPVARADVAMVDLAVPPETPAETTFQLFTPEGEETPVQVISQDRREDGTLLSRLLFPVRTEGLGYQVLAARAGSRPLELPQAGELTYENLFYRAAFEPDGTLASLRLQDGGQELVDGAAGRGNSLQAFSPDGERLNFMPTAGPQISTGAVAQVMTVAGMIGSARVEQVITLYHQLPRLDFCLTFDFNDTLFGNYWQDDSKLNVYWPVAPRGEMQHDIPFGVISGREERSFFATGWVRLGSAEAGLAFFHQGTNRFWVRRHVLANVLACGVTGRDIGTRARPELYVKDYDLRLKGRQVIQYAVYPHAGSWQQAGVPGQAFSYQHPLRVVEAAGQAGSLPARVALVRLESEALLPTALFSRNGGMTCRLFETAGTAAVHPEISCQEPWGMSELRSLAGAAVEVVEPFTIAEISLKQQSREGGNR